MRREPLEQQLVEYRENRRLLPPRKEHMQCTVKTSVAAFEQAGRERRMGFFEFLFCQSAYIQKRWWLFQMATLAVLWGILRLEQSSWYMQRCMGVLAPVFIIMVIPELWKNRSCSSMEIEGTAYFSLRQVYAARMLLFVMADLSFLSVFLVLTAATLQITLGELVIHFFLPMSVTCCISVGMLCSRRWGAESFAVGLCLVWIAVWNLMILKDSVYQMISAPMWLGAILGTGIYLVFAVRRVLKDCRNYWEVGMLWN